jgi:hypothetical protein
MTDTHDNDCLHCALWPVINKFCREHPDGCVEDVLIALTDVIGDILMFKRSVPRGRVSYYTKSTVVSRSASHR